jgi:hypothetical protein
VEIKPHHILCTQVQQKQCKPTPCWVLLMLMLLLLLLLLLLLPDPQAVLPLEWCPRSPPWSGGEPWLKVLWRHLLLVWPQRKRSLRLPCPQLRCERLHLLQIDALLEVPSSNTCCTTALQHR